MGKIITYLALYKTGGQMLFLAFQSVFSMLVKYYHTNLFCKGKHYSKGNIFTQSVRHSFDYQYSLLSALMMLRPSISSGCAAFFVMSPYALLKSLIEMQIFLFTGLFLSLRLCEKSHS